MSHDVFISHAVEDREVADRVCRAFEEQGIRCWMAPRDIPFGVDYEEAIVDAISASPLLVLILSASSNRSPYVKREIQSACLESSATQIIPFRVEDIPYSKTLRFYLGSTQWLDASTPPLEAHLRRLVEHVRSRLSASERRPALGVEGAARGEVRGERPEEIEAAGESVITRRPSQVWIIGGAVALLAVAVLVTLLAVNRKGEPDTLGLLVTPTVGPPPPSPTPPSETRDTPTPTPAAAEPTTQPTASPVQTHTPAVVTPTRTPNPPRNKNTNVRPPPEPVDNRRDDSERRDRIMENVIRQSLKEHGLSGVSVSVHQGVAALSGKVPKADDKERARDICLRHGATVGINLIAYFPTP